MQIKTKGREKRLRFIGPGKPRIIQTGEQSINPQDAQIEAMVSRAIEQGNYLPLSGGTLSGQLTAQAIILQGTLTVQDVNFILGTTTGTKIGTATTQKLSFFNSTPIVQPSAVGEVTGFTAGSGSAANDDSTYTGNVGTKAYTVGDIVKHLKNLGLIASS
jgi:hypothetical protein